MDFKFELNGFYLDNTFITFQSIESISETQLRHKDISYETDSSTYSFYISFISGQKIEVTTDIKENYFYKLYINHKITLKDLKKKRITLVTYIWSKLFGNICGPNLVENPRYMKSYKRTKDNCEILNKIYNKIEKQRSTLVKKFNQWKIYYFN